MTTKTSKFKISAKEQQEKKIMKRKLEDHTDVTPRKKKLIRELRQTKCTLASLKKSAKLIENVESSVLKTLVLDALKNQKRKSRGQRWSIKNKISALAIFKRSAKTYKYLSHIIPLPTIKTLQNLLKKIPVTTGINQAVLNHLSKISKDKLNKEKVCILMFDEISLKPCLIFNECTDQVEGYEEFNLNERTNRVADKALVFMVQGLYKKFKQPLSFYFVKGTVSSQKLSVLIKENVKAIQDTGFKIIATVCDQGPTNVGALKILTEASEKNYFYVDAEKIYYMFDIPHLLKSIRNNFLNHGEIIFDGRKGKWNHLRKVEEKNSSLLHLSKITKTHVEPKFRAKMRVKYAAQALSMTVSAVLKLMAEVENSEELMETALIVEELDKLFDYTNGPSGPKDIKKGRRQNVSAKTDHLEVWSAFRRKMGTLKFIKNNGTEARNARCIQGYITSLSTLQDLWHEVTKLGFKYLNLRQLNQDPLENLFGLIRQHSPTNKNPTCSSFIAALKTSIISGLTASHSRNANCEEDNQLLLTDFHDIISEKRDLLQHVEINEDTTEEERPEFPVLSLPDEYEVVETDLSELDQQPVVYVSGYIASTLKNYSCPNCISLLTQANPQNDAIYAYIRLREWWQDKQSLTYPSLELCRIIEKAVNTFEIEIINTQKLYSNNIVNLCLALFMANCDWTWFTCADHRNEIMNIIFIRLARLLIRRQCFRINQSYRLQEEHLNSANKKAEHVYKDKI